MVCVRMVSGMCWVWVGDVYEVWGDGGVWFWAGFVCWIWAVGIYGLWVVVYVQCGAMAGDQVFNTRLCGETYLNYIRR